MIETYQFTSRETNTPIVLLKTSVEFVSCYTTFKGTRLHAKIDGQLSYFDVLESVDNVVKQFGIIISTTPAKDVQRLTTTQHTPGEKHAYAQAPKGSRTKEGDCYFCGNSMNHILHNLSGVQKVETDRLSTQHKFTATFEIGKATEKCFLCSYPKDHEIHDLSNSTS